MKCTCHYEVSGEIVRHDIDRNCKVHGDLK